MEKPVSKMNFFFLKKNERKKSRKGKPPKFPVRKLNHPLSQWNGSLSFPRSSKPIDPLRVILFTAHAVLSLISRIKDWSIKIISASVRSKQTTLTLMLIAYLHQNLWECKKLHVNVLFCYVESEHSKHANFEVQKTLFCVFRFIVINI